MATGPDLVAIAVEDYSGIPVDHVTLVNFDGLIGVIDAVGGIEICVDHALREGLQDLLPAGC